MRRKIIIINSILLDWIKMSEIKHCVILVAYHESSSELLDAKASFTLLLLDVKSFKIPKLLIILYLIIFINYPEELIRDLFIILHGSAC